MASPTATTGIRVLLLDVEGTTTSVQYVYETLFPYARSHLRQFLESQHGQPKLQADLERLCREHAVEAPTPGRPEWRPQSEPDSAAAYLLWLMDRDRKSPALKAIQGRIWKAGFEDGELRGHVYSDVPVALRRWRESGKEVCIFSSGSVLAQQLLFAHTTEGDLSPFIRGYFDTLTGPKTDPASYCIIAESLDRLPAELLFISDSVLELDAARLAGMATRLCVRQKMPETGARGHAVLSNFDETV